jgi:hypothetical protein
LPGIHVKAKTTSDLCTSLTDGKELQVVAASMAVGLFPDRFTRSGKNLKTNLSVLCAFAVHRDLTDFGSKLFSVTILHIPSDEIA